MHKCNRCGTNATTCGKNTTKVFCIINATNVVKTQQMLRKYNRLAERLKNSPYLRDYLQALGMRG
jgi:hypothetical protein